MKKALELFAGTKSFWKVFEKSFEVTSLDIDNKFNCTITIDILKFNPTLNIKYDVIWSSPPCTSFSIAWCRYHRKNWKAISETAILWDKLVKKTLQIIEYYKKINPNLIWFIENPTGLLRKQDYMKKYNKYLKSITYCQYGHNCMKPTDIWTNLDTWIPRKKCKNWDSCHESSPRGSKKNWYTNKWLQKIPYWSPLRSIVPKELIQEIYNIITNHENTQNNI